MSSLCECCKEHMNRLNQQVSVMRKEIKNLRQMLDSAVRAHRKHLASVQTAVSKIGLSRSVNEPTPSASSPLVSLEKGNIQTVPIGYISSCFSVKNGTPRQPTICGPSRAELQIQQSVFNNPEHALVGLEQYSHVWIIFLFHKNGHLTYKAKVKPPRLNGQRVGVYSTRSPHRPNALGLTLAKLDKVDGDTLHLSDIDMIAGTPVLDIKPFIPDYDSPDMRLSPGTGPPVIDTNQTNMTMDESKEESDISDLHRDTHTGDDADVKNLPSKENDGSDLGISSQLSLHKDFNNCLEEVKAFVNPDPFQNSSVYKCQGSDSVDSKQVTEDHPCYGEDALTTIAGWIREPLVASLEVRFTPHAEKQLAEFLPAHLSGKVQKLFLSSRGCYWVSDEGESRHS
uniref:TsaA-like domain-containing protein n=1 Tax=Gouania willdenowi TaxID=441366 RepID=A0A8C5G993_GOUWI